jgi:hypothetical protein
MRIPRHLMGTPLPSFLPHATSTLPTSLPTRPILRHTMLLRRLRFHHFMASTTGQDPDRGYYSGIGSLELESSVTLDICCAMD